MRVTVVQYVCENIFEGLEKAAHHKCPRFLPFFFAFFSAIFEPPSGFVLFNHNSMVSPLFFRLFAFFGTNPPSRVVLFTNNLWFYLTFTL